MHLSRHKRSEHGPGETHSSHKSCSLSNRDGQIPWTHHFNHIGIVDGNCQQWLCSLGHTGCCPSLLVERDFCKNYTPGIQVSRYSQNEGTGSNASLVAGLGTRHTYVEQMVRQCHMCQQNRATPPRAPLQPWSWPKQPWSRLHIDFAGPLHDRMFLIVIDPHSKWMEVFPTSSSTSFATIQRLRTLFAQFGIPRTVVSDNGSCFTSKEFQTFMN